VAEPAARPCLSGGVFRRPVGQDPRRGPGEAQRLWPLAGRIRDRTIRIRPSSVARAIMLRPRQAVTAVPRSFGIPGSPGGHYPLGLPGLRRGGPAGTQAPGRRGRRGGGYFNLQSITLTARSEAAVAAEAGGPAWARNPNRAVVEGCDFSPVGPCGVHRRGISVTSPLQCCPGGIRILAACGGGRCGGLP
jgi:hypothetical protein